MLTSIGKFSKSFCKTLSWDNYSPLCFLGMGDVFRGGNQNVIATKTQKKLVLKNLWTILEN